MVLALAVLLGAAGGAGAADFEKAWQLVESAAPGARRSAPVSATPLGQPAAGQDAFDRCLAQLDSEPTAPAPPGERPTPRWRPISMPAFEDDESLASLAEAARRTAAYWKGRPDKTVSVGGRAYEGRAIGAALEQLAALAATGDVAAVRRAIVERFDAFESATDDGSPGKVTGYFSPTIGLVARPEPGKAAALYGPPPGELRTRFSTRQIADGALRGRGLELYGVPAPADLLTLQIQGSGWGRLPDGRRVFFAHAGSNGKPYRALVPALRKCRLVDVSDWQTLIAYLKKLPFEPQLKAVSLNPNFVYFKEDASGRGAPSGSTGINLVAGRSVAVDPSRVPYGLPAVLASRRVILDARNHVVGERDFIRLVFGHDKGGAIKGGGRVDLYYGDGDRAVAGAGRQNHPGRLFVLVPKAP